MMINYNINFGEHVVRSILPPKKSMEKWAFGWGGIDRAVVNYCIKACKALIEWWFGKWVMIVDNQAIMQTTRHDVKSNPAMHCCNCQCWINLFFTVPGNAIHSLVLFSFSHWQKPQVFCPSLTPWDDIWSTQLHLSVVVSWLVCREKKKKMNCKLVNPDDKSTVSDEREKAHYNYCAIMYHRLIFIIWCCCWRFHPFIPVCK